MSGAGREPCLLLISPGIVKWTDTDFGLPHLVSLGGYVQHHLGTRVEIIDLGYEGGDHEHLRKTLQELAPFLVIGLSCYSSYDYLRVMALARFVKTLYPETPLLCGGYHASALPQDLVFDGSPFDAVVTGEGEEATRAIVERLLGGGKIEGSIHQGGVIADLDTLPFYRWDLLDRYWPRAHDVGRKLQIYLSRGCPYHCTFCMEHAKSGSAWRAFSPERALEELRRLGRITPLEKWVVNVADPLFGFHRRWRREVLTGIVREGLLPRQYWALARSDDLDEEDVDLLARARFSIGVGVESGSPEMLAIMRKGNQPVRYLAALERLAVQSRKHRLNWAANIIVGHPGETLSSMRQTFEFIERLFITAGETCGWLSIDPFRLYPGSHVHANMAEYEARYGARFYQPAWWKGWYDGMFGAELVDPSREVSFEARVEFMYDHYPALVGEIARRFRGQGRSIDSVFARSLREQEDLMSERTRNQLLSLARQSKARGKGHARPAPPGTSPVGLPTGLQVRDPYVRRREESVRYLLEAGTLRTAALVEALLKTAPERYLPADEAAAMLSDWTATCAREGDVACHLGISTYVTALEALNPGPGESAIDLVAGRGYMAALLAALVGASGRVVAVHSGGMWSRRALARLLASMPVELRSRRSGGGPGPFDVLWLGAALPRLPASVRDLLSPDGGRGVTFLGPRFRAQDMVCLTRRDQAVSERVLACVRVPILAGKGGWLRRPSVSPVRLAP